MKDDASPWHQPWGNIGRENNLPDIIIDPHDGYDLKAGLKKSQIFESGPLSGMHTFYDAMLYLQNRKTIPKRPAIYDVPATILSLLDIPLPDDFDGMNLLG